MFHLRFVKKPILSVSRWDSYAVCIVLVTLLLQALNWRRFPYFIDCYYHLSVMRGFADAGGWVGVSFWEYAPFGRPHLYPPLFHILELMVFKLGFSVITVARFFDVMVYPCFLFSCWKVIRDLFSKESAFFTLMLLVSSRPLYLSVINNIPFTLAFLSGFLAFYCLEKKKTVSAAVCLALSFYAHGLMSWLVFGALFLYGLMRTEKRRAAFIACFWSCVLASPLLYHQTKYFLFAHPTRVLEFFYVHAPGVLYLLAALGCGIAVRRGGRFFYFCALTAMMSVLWMTNRDRFFSGLGLVPLSFLAALVLETTARRIFSVSRRSGAFLFLLGSFLLFFWATPVVVSTPAQKRPHVVIDSWLWNSQSRGAGVHEDKGRTFYRPDFIDEIVRFVEKVSRPEDIFYVNYNYGGGMIAALADRATSAAMLHEVLPFDFIDPVAQARFVLLFKDPDTDLPSEAPRIVERYGLKKAGETQLALLYVNENCPYRKRSVSAAVPWKACSFLFFAAVFVIVFARDKKKLT
jgi:hypothetical protein